MAKQIITDEESNLKRQARRRLLGAIALTILVVVLLPMVLDREPPAPSQDIELQIPNKDKVGEFIPKMVVPPLNANDAASAPVIAPLRDVKPDTESVPPKLETKPAVKLLPKAAIEQKVKQPEVKTVVEAKPAAKTGVAPHSGFVVQAGAFANASTAKQLQEKLHKLGYPSYTEKSGNKIRVRVGGYTTHAEADKVRRRLEIQGMKPDVVSPN